MRTALALAILTVLPLAAAASQPEAIWAQGGGPHRAGVADVYPDLDVRRQFNLSASGTFLSQAEAFETSSGVVSLAVGGSTGGQCQLLVVPDPAHNESRPLGGKLPCPGDAALAAVIPSQDLVLVCLDATSDQPLLHAYRGSDGNEAWTLSPGVTATSNGQAGNNLWGCGGVAVDEEAGLMVVPYSNDLGNNRVVAYTIADHHEVWAVSISALDANKPAPLPAPTNPLAGTLSQASGNVHLVAATRTATGVVVLGSTVLESVTVPATTTYSNLGTPFAAWFDLKGNLVGTMGAREASNGADPATGVIAQSRWAAADAGRAAWAAVGNLVLVDPTQPQAQRLPLASEDNTQRTGDETYASPVWAREALVVPLFGQAALCDLRGQASCTMWPAYRGGRILSAMSPGDGTAWFLVERTESSRRVSDLVRVRIDDPSATSFGTTLETVPIPLARTSGLGPTSDTRARLVALADGDVLLGDTAGDAVLLGPPDPTLVPLLEPSKTDPRAREAVRITARVAPDAPSVRQVRVAWGDGLVEELAPDAPIERSFGTPGDRDVRVTFVYADNRTATSLLQLHVGAVAAAQPGLLQKAFSAQYQNYTFFALGILVTVVGSVLTAIGVAKGRRRIDRRLRELDAIHDDGRRDPFGAVRELHAYRQARRRDLATGHLGDTQYTVLEAHAERVLQLLRQRILGGFVERVSEAFSHALDLALADGSIDASEGSRLADLVGKEPDLTGAERQALLVQLRSWQKAI